MIEQTPNFDAQVVKDKTLVLHVTVHSLWFTKNVPVEHPQISVGDAEDKHRFTVEKRTLEGPEIQALHTQESAIRNWVKAHSLAADLGYSFRLVALPMFPAIDERLEQFQAERAELVEALIEQYPNRMDEAKPALGSHWDVHDYPRIHKLRKSFRIEWNYRTTLDLPATMEEIDSAIAARERKKHAKEARRILDVAEEGVINTLHALIQNLANRLGKTEAGTNVRLHQSAVADLQEFLKYVQMMNVRGRDDLNELGAQAQKLLEGVTPETLRQKKNADFREALRLQMQEIALKLDPLVIRSGTRKIYDLEDEG